MRYLKKLAFIILFTLLFVGCDQSSKHIAKQQLESSSVVSCLYGLVRFVYVENQGGMLSLGSQLSEEFRLYVLIYGVSILLFILFIFLLFKENNKLIIDISLMLIFAGGIGNLFDRIFNDGRVIDFIIIGTSRYHTAVFNLADLFIMFGTILFIIRYSYRNTNTDLYL